MTRSHQSILVTGGAGFIGSNFILHWLATEGSRVVNLDKLTYAGNPANLADLAGDDRYVFARGDINDSSLVGGLLRLHKPMAIVHFAAESHVDRSIHNAQDFIRTNIEGTFQLLQAARAYWANLPEKDRESFRFLHVSTDEVYGSLGPKIRLSLRRRHLRRIARTLRRRPLPTIWSGRFITLMECLR